MLSVARLPWWSCWPPSTTTVGCTTAVWQDCCLATEATTAVWLDCRGVRAGHPDSMDIQNIIDFHGYHGKCVWGWDAPGRRTLPPDQASMIDNSERRFSHYMYRRFRGVSPACPPPVTGRSASFRLRFRFVRVVRAMRARRSCVGAYRPLSLSLGLPGASIRVSVLFRVSFRSVFVHGRIGFNILLCFPCPFDGFLCTGAWVF